MLQAHQWAWNGNYIWCIWSYLLLWFQFGLWYGEKFIFRNFLSVSTSLLFGWRRFTAVIINKTLSFKINPWSKEKKSIVLLFFFLGLPSLPTNILRANKKSVRFELKVWVHLKNIFMKEEKSKYSRYQNSSSWRSTILFYQRSICQKKALFHHFSTTRGEYSPHSFDDCWKYLTVVFELVVISW